MRSIAYPVSPYRPAPTHLIWLPGAYHEAKDFLAAGFAASVSQRQLALDLTFVDLEMEHLGDRNALDRLRSELVLPARAAGTSIWLGGISLGGFFALNYAASYADELDGLYLLAPYLGNRMLTGEIANAAGVADWQPGELAEVDEERRVWRYIKSRGAVSSADLVPVHLGFGVEDRFAAAHELLAGTLPTDCVYRIAGGHEWRTWSTLWEDFLDSRFI